MIDRSKYVQQIQNALARSSVTGLLGPRQSGKTTLARSLTYGGPITIFDLESPRDLLKLQNPELALSKLKGLVILDEIQNRPDLFPVLRVLADRSEQSARFLILGSASPDLIKKSSESLAGRIEFIDLHGFDLSEVGGNQWATLWLRGGFPKSYLALTEMDSAAWREGFIRTFLERDLPGFGIRTPAPSMRRFWMMLAHWHGQLWNASELGRSMGVSDHAVRSYLDILTETYMVRQLQPWHENLGKRQVKAPKIYLRDSGLLHSLFNTTTEDGLAGHPKVGASWEGFALEQVVRMLGIQSPFFWSTYSGAELDLFWFYEGKRFGFEFKYSENPTITRSMRMAVADLALDHLWIICPADSVAPLSDKITVVGIESLIRKDWLLSQLK